MKRIVIAHNQLPTSGAKKERLPNPNRLQGLAVRCVLKKAHRPEGEHDLPQLYLHKDP